jgi:hypothetical protein
MANAFSELKNAINEGHGYEPIRADEVAFGDEKFTDEAALKIVLQDVNVAETHFQSKTLSSSDFNLADDLFRAYVAPRNWPNTNIQRSNIPMPVVMEAIETALLPQAHMAFFSDPQPFLLEGKGQTSAEAARGMAHVGSWSVEESGFEEEIRKMLKSSFLYGQCVGKYGWRKDTRYERKYKRSKNGVESSTEAHDISCPTFEYVDVRQVLVDPFHDNHDIRGAAYVLQQKFIDAEELDSLRDQGYKNVPTRAELALILAERAEATKDSLQGMKIKSWREYQPSEPTEQRSSNPLKQPLEILEYWTDDRVVTVLQRCLVLRNEENEFGEKPFLSCSFIDVLNSFWGMGVSKLLEGEQRLQTGVLNAYVDALSLQLNPTWLRKKGLGAVSQNVVVGPGRIVNEEELEPLKFESVTEEAMTAIQSSEARSARRVGANYGPEMPTQAMRTAEGVQAFTSGVQVRLQYFIENFANLVFIPAIKAFIQLAKDNLTPEQVQTIIHNGEGKTYAGDILDVYNGVYSVSVLSSTKLSGRRAMAQMIPLMMQMVGQAPVQQSLTAQGKKFDFTEFLQQVFDITGWPDTDLLADMTPQEQQAALMAMNPQMAKAQMDAHSLALKHQNDMELEQAKGETRAGVQVVKHLLDQAKEAKELEGGAAKASAQAAQPLANQTPTPTQ